MRAMTAGDGQLESDKNKAIEALGSREYGSRIAKTTFEFESFGRWTLEVAAKDSTLDSQSI